MQSEPTESAPVHVIQAQVEQERLLEQTLTRMNAHILGVTFGLLSALALCLATLILVLKGGQDVGKHLGLLSNYFPGYDVSWAGLLPALFYGGIFGYAAGFLLSRTYNLAAGLRRGGAPNGR
jgi:hypothetical protein